MEGFGRGGYPVIEGRVWAPRAPLVRGGFSRGGLRRGGVLLCAGGGARREAKEFADVASTVATAFAPRFFAHPPATADALVAWGGFRWPVAVQLSDSLVGILGWGRGSRCALGGSIGPLGLPSSGYSFCGCGPARLGAGVGWAAHGFTAVGVLLCAVALLARPRGPSGCGGGLCAFRWSLCRGSGLSVALPAVIGGGVSRSSFG